jgi:hypothetical protein
MISLKTVKTETITGTGTDLSTATDMVAGGVPAVGPVAEGRAHKVYDLSAAGGMLVTRRVGKAVLAELSEILADLPKGGVLYVDTRNVEFLDYSFADEALGTLVSRVANGEFKDRFLVLVEEDRDLLENVEVSLRERKLAVYRVEEVGDEPEIVGEVPEHLLETLRIIQEAGSITNADLAARLGRNHTAVNNRVAKLARLGLIHRRVETAAPSGRQYIYEKVV